MKKSLLVFSVIVAVMCFVFAKNMDDKVLQVQWYILCGLFSILSIFIATNKD